MTSPNGINWTARAAAEANSWQSVTWSPELGLFVAVAYFGTNLVMTSPDGINWTARAAAEANEWWSVIWSPEIDLFVAVAASGTNRVMTSPDGITWTAQAAAGANSWKSVTWSPELGRFVAVTDSGTNEVMVGEVIDQNGNSEVSGTSTTSGGSTSSAPSCSDTAPTSAPNLFQIDRSGSSATLFFTPVQGANNYYIAYGYTPGDQRFGVQVNQQSTGVISYTVNQLSPNTTYYFQVRAGNGCAPGPWGNTMSTKTTGSTASDLPLPPNTGFGSFAH